MGYFTNLLKPKPVKLPVLPPAGPWPPAQRVTGPAGTIVKGVAPGGQITGHTGAVGPQQGSNPNVGSPPYASNKTTSDQRFRSFAERYMVARAHFFRVPSSEHVEDQWACVLDAKRAYSMIERAGQNINPEDGVF